MNVKIKALTAGVLFFVGVEAVMAQKKDSATTKQIDEVVVVGYQKKNKDQVSSAVSVISGESLSNFTGSTMGSNALQGRAAGLNISAVNGKPGTGSVINVRGLGNLTTSSNTGGAVLGANGPLYVIDGFVVGNDQRAQSIFNSINPTDYESVSVLKDAAAAAIYGSQGGNGVIVLTTKKGKLGKPTVTISSRMGFSNKIDDINFRMMNSSEKIDYEKRLNSLGITGYFPYTSQEEAEALAKDHNWQKDILRTSFIESHQVSVRAGSEKTKYSISLGYDNDNGIVENIHAYKRYIGRMGLESNPTDKLLLGASLGVNYSKTQEIRDRNNTQNPFRAMYDYNPYEPVLLDDGSYNPTFQGFPILEALKNNPSWESNIIFDGNVFAQYKITKNLSVKSQLGGYFNNFRSTSKTLKGSFLDTILGINGSVTEANQNRFKFTNTNTISYVTSLGNHNFDILGLLEYAEFKNDLINLQGRNFSSPGLSEASNTSAPFSTGGFDQLFKTFSYGAFLSYDYDRKYLLTASVRQDADSRFGKNNVYSEPFWSVSAAWNLTSEGFLKDNNFINSLKLRGSIGVRGYNNIDLNLNNILLNGGTYGNNPSLAPNVVYGNPDLKWETTKSQNYGVEFSVLKRRISGTIDYFIDVKKDFILNVPNASSEGGAYTTNINAGKLTNKGFEFSLNADVIKSKNGLNWSLRANTSILEYKLNKLLPNEKERIQGINILREGYEPFSFYLVRSAGVNPLNGNEQYFTKTGEITEVYNSNDAVLINDKSPLPKMFGGFGTTLTYKGIDFNADFSFKSGNYTYNYMAWNMLDFRNGIDSNLRSDASNFWTSPGQENVLPRPNNSSNAPGGIVGLQVTDRFLQDASFIRLRNISLGYTFSRVELGERFPVSKIRASVSGQNLVTWTKFEGDPEVTVGSGENQTGANQTFISGAYALYSYPAVKSILFGIDVEF